jgi:hypothetical protein
MPHNRNLSGSIPAPPHGGVELGCYFFKGKKMTLDRCLTYVCYSTKCPEGVSPYRWRAMLAFIKRIYNLPKGSTTPPPMEST